MTAVLAAIADRSVEARSLPELASDLFAAHADCIEAGLTAVKARQAELQAALRCGEALVQAKAGLAHGSWRDWLRFEASRHHAKLSERTAQEYMRLYSHWPEIEAVANARSIAVLSLTKRDALRLIAQPKGAKALQLRHELQASKAARQVEAEVVEREHEQNLRRSLPLEQLQTMSREQLQEELIVLNQEESDRAELLSGDSLVQIPARLTAKKRLLLELIEAQSEPEDATNRDFSEMFNQLNQVGLVEPSNNIHIIWISVDRYSPLHWLKANGCEERNRRVLGNRAEDAIVENQIEVEAKITAAIQEDCDRLNWPYRLQRVREGEARATVNGCGAIAKTARLAFIAAYLSAMKTRSEETA